MMYLIMGVLVALSSSVLGSTQAPQSSRVIGSYRIVETTHLYPKPNYYNQTLDCSTGISPDLFQSSSPNIPTMPTIPVAPGILPLDPGSGGGNTGVGNSVGNGPIIIDPIGNGSGGIPGSGAGGVGTLPVPSFGSGQPGISLEKIVNIGNIIWTLVEMGRPSAHVQTYRAHALPKGINCWTDLEDWQIPISKVYTVEYKNKMGHVIALYSYRISFVYGGSVDGVGKYIANLTVTPVDMRISWGFNFSSQVQIPATFNLGKKNNPLAGMQVFVFWSIGNSLKVEQKSALFYVTGDGRVQLTPAN